MRRRASFAPVLLGLFAGLSCSRAPSAAPPVEAPAPAPSVARPAAAPDPKTPAPKTPAPKTPDPKPRPAEVAEMSDALTHLPVKLNTPYYPWKDAYDRVAADPELKAALPAMRAALETGGPPEARLKAMAAAADAARGALAKAGRQADFSFNGLDPVELDMRVVFFAALAEAIAGAEAPVGERRAALGALRKLVEAPDPVGVPAANERRSWTATGRLTAQTKVDVQIEALDEQAGSD